MTRQELIEMVEFRLVTNQVGMDTVEMFSPQMISKHIELAYTYVLNQILEKKKQYNIPVELNSYSKTYKDIPIEKDDQRDEYYADLPVKPLELMENQAIRIVAPSKSLKDAFFARILGGHDFIMSSLDVNKMSIGSYYLEGERIYLQDIPDGLEKLQVIMIPSFDNYELNEQIVLPRDGETMVIETAIEMLIQKYNLPPDNVNDQSNL